MDNISTERLKAYQEKIGDASSIDSDQPCAMREKDAVASWCREKGLCETNEGSMEELFRVLSHFAVVSPEEAYLLLQIGSHRPFFERVFVFLEIFLFVSGVKELKFSLADRMFRLLYRPTDAGCVYTFQKTLEYFEGRDEYTGETVMNIVRIQNLGFDEYEAQDGVPWEDFEDMLSLFSVSMRDVKRAKKVLLQSQARMKGHDHMKE